MRKGHPFRGALLLRLAILALLAGTPHIAHALGLGRLIVSSGLDEPLNGRIEIISPTPQEIKTLKVSLASREEFEIAGVERGGLLFEIKYEVTQDANGRYSIHVTTLQPFREPFLHFLVRAEWSGGRLVREYSALLDPPQWAAGAPTEIDVPSMIPESPGPVATQKNETQITEQPVEELPAIAAAEEANLPATPAGNEAATTAPAAADNAEAAVAEKSQLAGESSATPPQAAAATPEPTPVMNDGVKPSEPATPEQMLSATAAAPVPGPAVAEAPSAPAGAQPVKEAASASAATATTAAEAPVDPMATKAARDAAREFGPVIRGDTLTQIAAKLNYDRGVTSQQVMIALLRANPSAFHQGNVNILYAGKILKVPERDRVATITTQEASRELRAQYDAWQEYKLKLAGASRLTTTPSVKAKKGEAVADTAKPANKKAEKQAKAAAKPDKPDKAKKDTSKAEPIDLLKIVRATLEQDAADDAAKTPGVETSSEGGKEKAKLTEKVATLEEAIESKQMQNKELRERVGKLQEQSKNAERLIEIENKELAKAQKQAAEKQAAEAKALAEAASKAQQEAAAREKEKAAALEKEKAAAAAAAKKSEQEKTVAPKPVEAAKPAETRQPAAPAASAAPETEESILDTLLAGVTGFSQNALALAVLGAIGAVAAVLGGFYYIRRRRATRDFTESILSGSSLTSESAITDTTNPLASTDTSFLSDFSQGGAGNVHHADEVDPIAEAEVYLAYGRDEQAEEILRDAITKDPTRQEVRGKLLEIYFQRNDVAAFETVAEELYAALEGKGGKIWEKVEEMGRKLSPGNPMFSGEKPASRPQALSTAATTMLIPESGLTFESTASSPTLSTSAATSLEFEVPSAAASSAPEASSGLDFSLNFDAPAPATPPSSLDMSLDFDAGTPSQAGADSGGMDMDFGLSGSTADTDTSSNAIDFSMSPKTELASDGLDFTLPTAAAEPASDGLDFSLSTAASEPASDGLDFTMSSTMESTAGGLDFSGFETTSTEPTAEASDTNVIDFNTASLGDTAIEFEGTATETDDAGTTAGLPGWDETATKLDLAKAYIDMGDAEGARSILDEVMAEGNESQKKQARDLASQIAA